MSLSKNIIVLVTLAICAYSEKIIVPDHCTSVQGAIDKSVEGDTVFVRIGSYHEAVVLKNGIALIGESMTGTIISGNKKNPVVIAADKTLIKNLTIQDGKSGILSENAALTIDQVIVRNNAQTGIHCLVTLPNIYNCIIHRNQWSGILCESTRSIKTSIIHNIIAENGYNGITLMGLSEALIMNNVIFANRQFGIWGVEESQKSRIIYNDFFNNRSTINLYLRKDPSNIMDDPAYPYVNGQYDYLTTSSIMLKGKGKDGATIGLIGGEVLTQKLTDPDEDGIVQDADKCPSIPEDMDSFEDDDGCPEFDNDNDGFFDPQDACPNSPEDYDGFRDDDGCLDDDNDKDGIPDSVDICKNNPETVNSFKDDDGCPDEIPPGTGTKVPPPSPVPQKNEMTTKPQTTPQPVDSGR
jgi:OmpA-OmpF porin, OOP family